MAVEYAEVETAPEGRPACIVMTFFADVVERGKPPRGRRGVRAFIAYRKERNGMVYLHLWTPVCQGDFRA